MLVVFVCYGKLVPRYQVTRDIDVFRMHSKRLLVTRSIVFTMADLIHQTITHFCKEKVFLR